MLAGRTAAHDERPGCRPGKGREAGGRARTARPVSPPRGRGFSEEVASTIGEGGSCAPVSDSSTSLGRGNGHACRFAVLIWLAFPGAGRGAAPASRRRRLPAGGQFGELRLLGEHRVAAAVLRPDAAGEEHHLQGAVRHGRRDCPPDERRHPGSGVHVERKSLRFVWSGGRFGSEHGRELVGEQLVLADVVRDADGDGATAPADTGRRRVPPPTNTVYIEHVNVIVDASSTTDACSTQGFIAP